jgi:hypothetical protein
VELHGVSLSYKSEIDKGTTSIERLPPERTVKE